jgi:hypothetical protein
MARIHELAVLAADTTNLIDLSGYLVEATKLVIGDMPPHTHPVVRLICHMIAFAGDGDLASPTYYKEILDYCVDNLETEKPEGELPREPDRKAS